MSYQEYLKVMVEIGMPLAATGTNYTIEFLQLINSKEYNHFKDVYKTIAQKHSTGYKNIEKCIASALNTCRDKPSDYKTVEKYLGYARTSVGETLIHLDVAIKINKNEKTY